MCLLKIKYYRLLHNILKCKYIILKLSNTAAFWRLLLTMVVNIKGDQRVNCSLVNKERPITK